jgi:hypothetical protein
MDARISSRQKRISKRQEKYMAEDLGGCTMPGSGAMPNAKSDVRVRGEIRGEAKFTNKSHYTLKLQVLEKIQKEALEGGLEDPVLQLEYMRKGRTEASFAIWPLEPNHSDREDLLRTRLTTTAKSMILGLDRLELHVTQCTRIYICFDNKHVSKWYAVANWKDYLKWRAENA